MDKYSQKYIWFQNMKSKMYVIIHKNKLLIMYFNILISKNCFVMNVYTYNYIIKTIFFSIIITELFKTIQS